MYKGWLKLDPEAVATLRTDARKCHVMTVEFEAQGRVQFSSYPIKDVGGDFVRHVTDLARHVPVGTASQVVDGRRVTSVRVHHESETLEFLQDPVHGGRTHVGSHLLDVASYLISGEVVVRADQNFHDRTLRGSDAFGVFAQRLEHFLSACLVQSHEPSVEPGLRPNGNSLHLREVTARVAQYDHATERAQEGCDQ